MKKFSLPTILSTTIVISLFAVSVISWKDPIRENQELRDWMGRFSDEIKLNELSIPGSHDSGARYGLLDAVGKCQDLTIESQLNIGIRFLDIRLKLDGDGSFHIIHGPVNERLSFTKVLDTCNTFLSGHPTETILFSIKNEGVDEERLRNDPTYFDADLKSTLEKEERFLLDRDLPESLGECRGKMILLSRYKNSSIGVDCYNGWWDNNTSTLSNGIHVQDHYEVETIEDKKKDIQNALNYESTSLNLNFTSGYIKDSFPPYYSYSIAKEINPWIINTIKEAKNLGVLIADFVSTAFTTAVIGGNR